MSQHLVRSPSSLSGTGYATKDRHLPLRTSDSIADINNLPVAFEIVSPTNTDYGPATPARSRSFTAYDEMMRNEDEARRVARSDGSLAEIKAIPSISLTRERDARTMGRRLISAQSREDLKKLPDLTFCSASSISGSGSALTLRNSDYAYGPYSPVTLNNSDYAYYPPVLRNSDYAYSYDKSSMAVTPTNSSYCYVNPDGTYRLASSYPPTRARSLSPNPYAALPGYRMQNGAVSSTSLVGTEPITSAIYLGGYERKLLAPQAPNSATLNKNIRGAVSMEDLEGIQVTFTERPVDDGRGNGCPLGAEKSTSTPSAFGRLAIRDFCRESMEELRQLPSISSYAFDQEEPDVLTARSLRSPAKQESNVYTALSPSQQEPDVYTAHSLRSPTQQEADVHTARSIRSPASNVYTARSPGQQESDVFTARSIRSPSRQESNVYTARSPGHQEPDVHTARSLRSPALHTARSPGQQEPDVFTARSLRSPVQQTADVKTAECICTPPTRTFSRLSTARSPDSTDLDGLKYFPEALAPSSSSRRRSTSSARRQ